MPIASRNGVCQAVCMAWVTLTGNKYPNRLGARHRVCLETNPRHGPSLEVPTRIASVATRLSFFPPMRSTANANMRSTANAFRQCKQVRCLHACCDSCEISAGGRPADCCNHTLFGSPLGRRRPPAVSGPHLLASSCAERRCLLLALPLASARPGPPACPASCGVG